MESTPNVAVLDTDIGSDVDDILALTLMLQSPELNLIGVTTVYGDTVQRGRMIRYVSHQFGRHEIVVAPGERETLAGRPVWWSGHEGKGIANREGIDVDEARSGVGYLCETARHHTGKLDVFAIGPLTNIARAVQSDPAFASSVNQLYVMGGAYWMEKPEHNIKCDPEAAAIVFGSGIPMTVCGLDVTTRVWLRPEDTEAIERSLGELGGVIGDMTRTWLTFMADSGVTTSVPNATNLHDPLAVLAAMRPNLFTFRNCDIEVDLAADVPGRTTPSNCGSGKIRIASEVDVSAAEREMMRRITGQQEH